MALIGEAFALLLLAEAIGANEAGPETALAVGDSESSFVPEVDRSKAFGSRGRAFHAAVLGVAARTGLLPPAVARGVEGVLRDLRRVSARFV